MRTRIVVFVCAVFVVLSAVALADIVILHSGAKIEGIARREGDKVVIENVYGSTTIAASLVKEIVTSKTPLAEYRELASRASASSAEEQTALADWCRQNNLADYEKHHLARALALEPESVSTRSRLGYVEHRGRYLTKSEEMFERGYVRFRGRWLTAREYSREILEQEVQAQRIAQAKAAEKEKKREERDRRIAEYLAEERERQERESLEGFGVPYTSSIEPYQYRRRHWWYDDYLLGRALRHPYYPYSPYGAQPWVIERVPRAGDFRREPSVIRVRR